LERRAGGRVGVSAVQTDCACAWIAADGTLTGVQRAACDVAALPVAALPLTVGGGRSGFGFGWFAMGGDAGDDESDGEEFEGGGDLGENDHADDDGGGRQKRYEEGVGRSREPGHGELVEDVWDNRGANADTDAGGEGERVEEGIAGIEEAEGCVGESGDDH